MAVIQRQKEFWGDNPFGPVDRLKVATSNSDIEPVQVINPATASFEENFVLGIVTFDANSDGVSNTEGQLPVETFLSVVDVYYHAADPPDASITFELLGRGETRRQLLNTPNWASNGHGITAIFRDWVQDIDTWDQCRKANLC